MAVIQRRRLFSSSSADSAAAAAAAASLPSLAVVTGAGSGIGRAVCHLLSQRGVHVVAADLRGEQASETLSQLAADPSLTHLAQQVDVSSRDSVESLFAKVSSHYDGLAANILVNCAGITRDALMHKMTDQQFDEVISVNVKGTYMPTQVACRAMIAAKRPWGSVVNVSSTSGKYGNIGQVNYAASKAAIYGLTKSVAKEMARYNVRCNAVVPGFIDTPMVASVPEHLAQLSLMLIALRRKGRPDEVAEAIAFLASERSSYITGTTIDVTGGFLM